MSYTYVFTYISPDGFRFPYGDGRGETLMLLSSHPNCPPKEIMDGLRTVDRMTPDYTQDIEFDGHRIETELIEFSDN